jgi:hypothetical protein
MRKPRSVVFESAVLALLAATAGCGGSIVVVDDGGPPGSGSGFGNSVVDAGAWTPPDANPACGWTNATQVSQVSKCVWDVDFTGDPMTCLGFVGHGTPQQCEAVCGHPFGSLVSGCQFVPQTGPMTHGLSCGSSCSCGTSC